MNYLLWTLAIVGAARLLGLAWNAYMSYPQVHTHALQIAFGAWAAWFLVWDL